MKENAIRKTLTQIKKIGDKKLNASITIRIDNDTKQKFEEICSEMGLSISSAISTFVNKVVNVGGIPFDLTTQKKKRELGIANGKYNIDYEEFNRLDEDITNLFGA